MRSRLAYIVGLLLTVTLTASACPRDSGDKAGPAGPGGYPRNETLYASGTQWGPREVVSLIGVAVQSGAEVCLAT